MKQLALTTRPLAGKVRRYFWVLLFATYSVGAAGVVIDVLADEYRHLSQVAVTTARSSEDLRMSGAAQIAAVYRASSGAPFSTLPPGSTFKVVWPDGSSEYVMVVSPTSASGARPIAGTQSAARALGDSDLIDAAADASAQAATQR
ncbi:hypothetical protein [Lysobacter auxotrophicus]|uniref:Uncharacterized protein n=1 Tax=Lysobacter auxotrophicus TaxID=2992573 RepID=A0ABN6UP30_9GAMM|nr:hypothetical protein [Lysobacter auxotrophicus]BDU18046.1 hypothetical protein LA521A_32470 [Lysobacter auxotrophicus]